MRPEIIALAARLAGCIPEPEIEDEIHDSELASAEANLRALPPVPASLRGWACGVSCGLLVSTGCAKVLALCSGVTTITLGGFTIPCVWATSIACVAGPAIGGPTCAEICAE